MKYWLIKSEPDAFSWEQLVATGEKGEPWNGVRNHSAKLNMMAMRIGDRAFYYHSNIGKEIVGIAEVIRESYPDPTDASGKFVCVDFKAVQPVVTPVTLSAVKADTRLAEMALIKLSRLSVQPVTAAEWKIVSKLAGL